MEIKLRYVIFYRENEMWKEEQPHASKYFYCTNSRLNIQKDDFVIGRYSVLPFYKEQERDINIAGANLINSYKQHRYVADMWNWYGDLEDLTPKTWNRYCDIPDDIKSLVVKGETNSRKHLWNTHMFAPSKEHAKNIMRCLMDDSLIGSQNIYFREFEEFETLGFGIRGIPLIMEFRIFICNEKILSGGYYWSSNLDELDHVPSIDIVPKEFLTSIIERIGNKIPFYALDIAKRKDGVWRVVELNDGQMSGLSENNPETLYKNLHSCLTEKS